MSIRSKLANKFIHILPLLALCQIASALELRPTTVGSFSYWGHSTSEVTIGSTGKFAFGYGVLAETGLTPEIGLEFGVLSISRKYSFTILGLPFSRSQKGIELPVAAQVRLFDPIVVNGGFYDLIGMGDVTFTDSVGSVTQTYADANLKRNELGFLMGLEGDFSLAPTTKLAVEMRYTQSLTNVSTATGDKGVYDDILALLGVKFGL